jgi:hypothetical protein
VFSYIDSHTKLKKPVGLLFYACFIFSGYPLSVGISKGSGFHLVINGMNVNTRDTNSSICRTVGIFKKCFLQRMKFCEERFEPSRFFIFWK